MSTTDPIPVGLCQCGCGAKTKLAVQTARALGYVKGRPMRYLRGHSNRQTLNQYIVEDRDYETPCWVWQLGVSAGGYGMIRRNGRMQLASRWFYMERHGVVLPRGHKFEIHHKCEVRSCVNPDHLELLSLLDHRRGHAKVTLQAADEICQRYAAGGITTITLAVEYGISKTHVKRIIRGESPIRR